MAESIWPSNTARAFLQKIVDDALRQFLEGGFADGSTVPKVWFCDALRVPRQQPDMRLDEGQKLQTMFLDRFETFRSLLLVSHRIALQSDFNHGYKIVPPAEQSKWAQNSLNNDLSSSFRKASQRTLNVRVETLTNAEKNERLLVLAGIAATEAAVSSERVKLKRRKAVSSGD